MCVSLRRYLFLNGKFSRFRNKKWGHQGAGQGVDQGPVGGTQGLEAGQGIEDEAVLVQPPEEEGAVLAEK